MASSGNTALEQMGLWCAQSLGLAFRVLGFKGLRVQGLGVWGSRVWRLQRKVEAYKRHGVYCLPRL